LKQNKPFTIVFEREQGNSVLLLNKNFLNSPLINGFWKKIEYSEGYLHVSNEDLKEQ
jgi:hypothetical protein